MCNWEALLRKAAVGENIEDAARAYIPPRWMNAERSAADNGSNGEGCIMTPKNGQR
jgi:hypothetical protein